MVVYKIQIIYHIKCICKGWIPKFHNGKGAFPDLVTCPKCNQTWRPKDLLEPPISAKIDEKVFDSELLLMNQIKYAMDEKNMEREQANSYAVLVVAKQKKIFEEKYSIPIGVQQVFG